jgi:hypothetical protein
MGAVRPHSLPWVCQGLRKSALLLRELHHHLTNFKDFDVMAIHTSHTEAFLSAILNTGTAFSRGVSLPSASGRQAGFPAGLCVLRSHQHTPPIALPCSARPSPRLSNSLWSAPLPRYEEALRRLHLFCAERTRTRMLSSGLPPGHTPAAKPVLGAWLSPSAGRVRLNTAVLPSRGVPLESVIFVSSSCVAQDFRGLCEESAFDFLVMEGAFTPALHKQALSWIFKGPPVSIADDPPSPPSLSDSVFPASRLENRKPTRLCLILS